MAESSETHGLLCQSPPPAQTEQLYSGQKEETCSLTANTKKEGRREVEDMKASQPAISAGEM